MIFLFDSDQNYTSAHCGFAKGYLGQDQGAGHCMKRRKRGGERREKGEGVSGETHMYCAGFNSAIGVPDPKIQEGSF